jgi:hypothetical protein
MPFIASAVPWPILLALGVLYILGCTLSAALVYAIAKAAINKATPENLPVVIREIAKIRIPSPRFGERGTRASESIEQGRKSAGGKP